MSDDAKQKMQKKQRKAELSRRMVCKSLPDERLQEHKEAAREELRQTKKEVQTEKLKGAATTAATNIAESVGSLFGSNKVKTLER